MNCYQITLKSGQQLQICTEHDLLKVDAEFWKDHYSINEDEIAAIIDVGANNIASKKFQDQQVVTP